MSSFEDKVKAAAEEAILNSIMKGEWLAPNYQQRQIVPPEWIEECWSLVDKTKLQRQIATRLEAELADRIINRMAEEISTYIIQVLSIKERREAIRALVRDNLTSIMQAGEPHVQP